MLYIRSVIEQSAVVWHSSITKGERNDLERTQKVALRIMLGSKYTSYQEALNLTGLETLANRRQKLCFNFDKKCVKNDGTSWMFPEKFQLVETRHPEKFIVTTAKTDRLGKSAMPYMQKLLNSHGDRKGRW